MSKGTVILLVVIGCILLALANVALWVTLDVFNADRFGEHIAEGLQSEASAEALAGPIVDQLLLAYPDFPALLRGPAEEVVVWTLQRPVFTAVVRETAAVAHKAMTTSAEDVVGIDLRNAVSNVGDTVVGVISTLDAEAGAEAEAALESVEEGERLAIYESGRFPALRSLSNLTPWLALLAGIGAIVLFVVAYSRAQDQHQALQFTSIGIMATAGLGFLLVVPIVTGTAQNNIANPSMRIVVGEVLSALLRGYAVQSLLLFFIGLILLAVNHYRTTQSEQAEATQDTEAASRQPA
ncbi:MAG: hypothetical protein JSW55_10115 [Chloroflexota bacterium]|nr:MAG: hypothetical protein JSW55_10115 [Chloroflexota bacterium]